MISVKELIIKKYLQNQTCGGIFRDLSKFNVKRNFVYQTVKRNIETGSSQRRKHTTQKRSVTTRLVVKKIRERIRRKCDISVRKLAADLKLNLETVRLVLKNCLQLSAYKKKNHGITSATVEKRFKRAKILLSWHAGDEIIREDVCPGATTEQAK
jgi:transposase